MNLFTSYLLGLLHGSVVGMMVAILVALLKYLKMIKFKHHNKSTYDTDSMNHDESTDGADFMHHDESTMHDD